MRVWSLASGSSGNCYLLQEGPTYVLVEAGISARRVAHEMARLGVSLSQLSAVLVSHEHVDHWASAVTLARRAGAPLVCTPGTLEAGRSGPRGLTGLDHQPIRPGQEVAVDGLRVEAFAVPHDAREPVGFLVRSSSASLCLATDMGTAFDEVVERARSADLVILESNHDEGMLVRGPYPLALKERILGRFGHLSNAAAGEAMIRIAAGRPRQFWLAHLSSTNNSPAMALASARDWLKREGPGSPRVDVALRDRRSLFWDSAQISLQQLSLF